MEKNSEQKNFPFCYIIYLLSAVVVVHFTANTLGVYEAQIQNGFVWIDNLLHAATGAAFGLLFLWLLNKNNLEYSASARIILTLVFVFCLAIIWELIELGFFKFFTSYAHSLKIYSPSILEACSDIISNMVGVVILLLFKR